MMPYEDINQILARVYSDYRGNNKEKLVLITDDDDYTVIESGDKYSVAIPLGSVIRALAKKGKHMGQVVSIVHNHNRDEDVSAGDVKGYGAFKNIGFKGGYYVYHPRTGRLLTVPAPKEK